LPLGIVLTGFGPQPPDDAFQYRCWRTVVLIPTEKIADLRSAWSAAARGNVFAASSLAFALQFQVG